MLPPLLNYLPELNSENYFGTNNVHQVEGADATYRNIMIPAVTHLLGSDCHAAVVEFDGKFELLFNSYNESDKTIRENISDQRIRLDMIDNLHATVFVHFHRRNKPAALYIYMLSGNDRWVAKAEYTPEGAEPHYYTLKTYGRWK